MPPIVLSSQKIVTGKKGIDFFLKKEKEFIVCHSCGSTDMRWLLGGKLGDQYRCMACGYEGIALKGSARFLSELRKRKKK